MEQQQYIWDDNKVLDFVNWYIELHQLGVNYKLENRNVLESFKSGDDYKLWHSFKENTKREIEVKKLYRLRHIPSGMFFNPMRPLGNISLGGKVYDKLPSPRWGRTIELRFKNKAHYSPEQLLTLETVFGTQWTPERGFSVQVRTQPTDWEIVEFKN